jgi:hypothetical protein
VIRALGWETYDGWTWLDGYVLDENGEAALRRTIFVLIGGVERVPLHLQRRTHHICS